MDALCEFVTSGATQTCKVCGRTARAGKRVRARCQRIILDVAATSKGPCQFLGPQSGLRDCKSCRGNVRVKEFACTQPQHVADGRGTTTYADCQRCGDYHPMEQVTPAELRHVLFRFQHGVGDHVQFSVVLQHLKALHPHVVVDVCTPHPDRLAGVVEAGLCRRVLTEANDQEYDIARPIYWHEPTTVYADSPSTKAEKCLREVFGITPQPKLCGYKIQPADMPPLMAEPFVLIHYRGWTMRRVKDVDENAIRAVVRALAGHGFKAVILDLDGQSQLDEPNAVHVRRDHALWGGSVDTAKVAGLAKQAKLCIGIDSGPGKLFSAAGVPSIIVWRGNHPVQYHGLDQHAMHLVPQQHERLLISGGRPDFFERHYRYRVRRTNLGDDLTSLVLDMLTGMVYESGYAYQFDTTQPVQYGREYWDKYVGYRDTPISRRINEARVALVARHMPRTEVVMDVGIGSGEFLEAWGNGSLGYDVNPYGREWLDSRGQWSEDVEHATAVTLWDVLEHMQRPDDFLRRLQYGAKLFVSLPIFFDLRNLHKSRHFRPNEHFWYWTHEGFLAWMDNLGFDLLESNDMETVAGRESIRSYAFRRRGRSILITAGIGDFIAIESHWTPAFRQSVERVYYATSMQASIRLLLEAMQDEFPLLRTHEVVWPDCSVNAATLPLPRDVEDWSIHVAFPQFSNRLPFVGSSLLRRRLCVVKHQLPERYAVIVPYSIKDKESRDFEDFDWWKVRERLAGLPGVVLNVGGGVVPGGFVDLSNATSITESIEIVKGAAMFLGCASMLSVIAAQCLPASKLFIKGENPHLLRNLPRYYAPHTEFPFVQPRIP